MSRRYQPLREIEETMMVPIPAPPGSVGAAPCGRAHYLLDILSCGHVLAAKLLMSPSRTPYVRDGERRYRKCRECPRVSKAEAAINREVL